MLRWQHARLEGVVTLSWQLASALVADDPHAPLTPENLDALQPRLRAEAAKLLALRRVAAGSARNADENGLERDEAESPGPPPLAPSRLAVAITAEGEVEFRVVWPADAEAGALELRAPFLARVTPDAFCLLQVWDGPDHVLTQELIERHTGPVEVPAPALAAEPVDSRGAAGHERC